MTDHTPNPRYAQPDTGQALGRTTRHELLTDAFAGKLLTPEQAADLLDVSVQDLADMRAAGVGPHCGLLSPQVVRYHRDDLQTWQTTSSPPAPPAPPTSQADDERQLTTSPHPDPAFEETFALFLHLSENAEHNLDMVNRLTLAEAFNEFTDFGLRHPQRAPAPSLDLDAAGATSLLRALTTRLLQMAVDAGDLNTALRVTRALDLVATIKVNTQ